jgi:hypothetical protein
MALYNRLTDSDPTLDIFFENEKGFMAKVTTALMELHNRDDKKSG